MAEYDSNNLEKSEEVKYVCMLTNKIKIIILISKYIPKTKEICYSKIF